METPPPSKSTISGDLPIRMGKTPQLEQPHVSGPRGSTAPTKTVQMEDDHEENPKLRPGVVRNEVEDNVSVTLGQAMTQVGFKKRKHKRPKSKRGAGKPTGFEEYNADGPITPKEYNEIRDVYSLDRPFLDRIEEALMRFQQKRRIEPNRRNVFHKYLQYGGITVGPNFGTGVSPQELKDMDEEEAMKARCQTALAKEIEGLEVNFDKVARGFLGSYFVRYFNPDNEDDIKLGTVTIKNFYTYLLFHEVCPEYQDDIERARKTCDLAQKELCKNLELVSRGPGAFNKACSMHFGGYFFISGGFDEGWLPKASQGHDPLSLDSAREVIKFAIAAACPYENASRFQGLVNQNAVAAKKLLDIDGFEVVSVTEVDPSARDFYHEFAPQLKPVGKIKARSFRDPAKPDIDMSAEERWEWAHGKAPEYELEFLVEMDLLEHCYPGLKVITSVWKLNCDVFFFDEIITAYPSFYMVLANDMMLGWRHPRTIEAPKANEPETVLQAGVHGAVKDALEATGHDVKKDEKGSKKGMDEGSDDEE
ncbi:uncharacterized protein N7459_003047 [Penicillium hispanicum]|uniref:uncharacterized protein n=1 Tax=Penicillium hispanicum TaxID=1080232 RepID=UPI002541C87B|nr:uncharacterized protein N7459_003047 [Penicillium hispanicum]KAJ5587282.1 hypothetical protein N7459_003047 [Penicillium hispanicum]